MTLSFTWEAAPSRVALRRGALDSLADELQLLGCRRALLVGGGASVTVAIDRVRRALGDRVADVVAGAEPHVPAHIVESAAARARLCGADAVISLGGGSAIGLAKAVAVTCDLPQIAVPTTYSGSEMTPIWARSLDGRKVTAHDPRALPRSVLYDPDLCRGMPPRLAAASGMNALAHCFEALWTPRVSPMTIALAEHGVRRLLAGLPPVVADPFDVAAHAENLAGACLAGLALAQTGTGIHHRTCHVLGGGWGLSHAETHAVILPHSIALVTAQRPDVRRRLAALLGHADPAQRVFTMLNDLGLPRALDEIGMPSAGLDDAARRIVAASSGDPLVSAAAVRDLLDNARAGRLHPGEAAPASQRSGDPVG
jgi:maleylacetate reductase